MAHIHSPLAKRQAAIYHAPARARNASVPNRRARTLAVYPSLRGGDPSSSRRWGVMGGGGLEPLYADLIWSRFNLHQV